MNKKYLLKFGMTLFLIALVCGLYYAMRESNPQDVFAYILDKYMPGISVLHYSLYFSKNAIYPAAIILSIIYGVVGSLIGAVYGMRTSGTMRSIC